MKKNGRPKIVFTFPEVVTDDGEFYFVLPYKLSHVPRLGEYVFLDFESGKLGELVKSDPEIKKKMMEVGPEKGKWSFMTQVAAITHYYAEDDSLEHEVNICLTFNNVFPFKNHGNL